MQAPLAGWGYAKCHLYLKCIPRASTHLHTTVTGWLAVPYSCGGMGATNRTIDCTLAVISTDLLIILPSLYNTTGTWEGRRVNN